MGRRSCACAVGEVGGWTNGLVRALLVGLNVICLDAAPHKETRRVKNTTAD